MSEAFWEYVIDKLITGVVSLGVILIPAFFGWLALFVNQKRMEAKQQVMAAKQQENSDKLDVNTRETIKGKNATVAAVKMMEQSQTGAPAGPINIESVQVDIHGQEPKP